MTTKVVPDSMMWWKEKLVNDELMKDPPSVRLENWGTIRTSRESDS